LTSRVIGDTKAGFEDGVLQIFETDKLCAECVIRSELNVKS